MSASLKAHFAAVMGNSLTRNCRELGWSVEDALRDDDTMTAAMRTYAIDEDPLYSAMAEHVRWILMKIEQGIVADIRATDPDFEVSSDLLNVRSTPVTFGAVAVVKFTAVPLRELPRVVATLNVSSSTLITK